MTGRKLVSHDEAEQADGQHTEPCSDCPWSRDALHGWLGDRTVDDWLQAVHGESQIYCHTLLGAQCAGSAIYRANVCKLPRDEGCLRLKADRAAVFASPAEFKTYHQRVRGREVKDDDSNQ